MRRNIPSSVVIRLLLLLSVSSCGQRTNFAQDSALDREGDQADIRALVAANIAASSALDPAAVQDTYTPDGDAWIAGLSRVSTRAGVIDAEAEYQALPGFQRFEGSVDSVRFISRDAAIVEMSATTVLDSGEFDEETTLVVARTDLGWKIAAWRVMTVHPAILALLKN